MITEHTIPCGDSAKPVIVRLDRDAKAVYLVRGCYVIPLPASHKVIGELVDALNKMDSDLIEEGL